MRPQRKKLPKSVCPSHGFIIHFFNLIIVQPLISICQAECPQRNDVAGTIFNIILDDIALGHVRNLLFLIRGNYLTIFSILYCNHARQDIKDIEPDDLYVKERIGSHHILENVTVPITGKPACGYQCQMYCFGCPCVMQEAFPSDKHLLLFLLGQGVFAR